MKIYSYRNRAVFILIATCLFVGAYAADPAMASDTQSRRVDKGSARLIIRRIPNLGNHVIVDLYVDGVPFATIGFGHTYEGYLAPGRHILSVIPTPGPKWPTPWQMTLDARSGQTYYFTAMGDHSGALILKGGEIQELGIRN